MKCGIKKQHKNRLTEITVCGTHASNIRISLKVKPSLGHKDNDRNV